MGTNEFGAYMNALSLLARSLLAIEGMGMMMKERSW
jgi:hypothetical protein